MANPSQSHRVVERVPRGPADTAGPCGLVLCGLADGRRLRATWVSKRDWRPASTQGMQECQPG